MKIGVDMEVRGNRTNEKKRRKKMIFKTIIIIYCLVGLTYNVLLIPKKNKIIYEQNEYILERYRQMERVLNKMERNLKDE